MNKRYIAKMSPVSLSLSTDTSPKLSLNASSVVSFEAFTVVNKRKTRNHRYIPGVPQLLGWWFTFLESTSKKNLWGDRKQCLTWSSCGWRFCYLPPTWDTQWTLCPTCTNHHWSGNLSVPGVWRLTVRSNSPQEICTTKRSEPHCPSSTTYRRSSWRSTSVVLFLTSQCWRRGQLSKLYLLQRSRSWPFANWLSLHLVCRQRQPVDAFRCFLFAHSTPNHHWGSTALWRHSYPKQDCSRFLILGLVALL